MSRFREFKAVFLVALYLFYFASLNLFIHTHESAEGRIVHSHPYASHSHSHTQSQFHLILTLSEVNFLEADSTEFDSVFYAQITDAVFGTTEDAVPGQSVSTSPLRAPPSMVC